MKRYVILIICLIVYAGKADANADSVYTFVFREPLDNSYSLGAKADLLFDTTGNLTFDDVYNNPEINRRFKPGNIIERNSKNNGGVVWRRIRLVNLLPKPVYYRMGGPGDTIQAYEIDDGKVYTYLTGILVDQKYKGYETPRSSIPLFLKTNEAKTFYLRIIKNYDIWPVTSLAYLYLVKEKVLRQKEDFDSFYAGIMIMLIALAVFLGFIFRDKQYFVMALPVAGMFLWFIETAKIYYLGPYFTKYGNTYFTGWFMPSSIIVFLAYFLDT